MTSGTESLFAYLSQMCASGSITPGQAKRVRELLDLAGTYVAALEDIAERRGEAAHSPIMVAKRALGRPEPGDTTA